VTIHSDPVEVGVLRADEIAASARVLRNLEMVADSATNLAGGVPDARAFLLAGRNRVAAFIPAL
jgi:hypothetical protein